MCCVFSQALVFCFVSKGNDNLYLDVYENGSYQDLKNQDMKGNDFFEASTCTTAKILMKVYINLLLCESKQGTNFKVRKDSRI